MLLKKLLITSSILLPSVLYGAEIKQPVAFNSTVDFMGSVGVVSYGNFPVYNSLDSVQTATYVGYNLNVMGLYNLITTYFCYVVVGTGLSFVRATTNQVDTQNYYNYTTSDTKQGEINTGFVDLYAGLKFILSNEMNLYTLGNFGYSIYNDLSSSDHLTTINYNNTSIDYYQINQLTINDHIKFGARVIWTYALSENYGVGFAVSWAQHKMAVSGNSLVNVSNVGITNSNYSQNTNISSFSTYTEGTGSFLMYFSL